MQGDTLIPGAKGSAQLHLLDVKTGKERAVVDLSGSGIQSLACHSSKGYVFAADQGGIIYAVDVKSTKGWKTSGEGAMLAVDPSGSGFVYAARSERSGNISLSRTSARRRRYASARQANSLPS